MIASSVIKWYPDKTIYGVFDGRYKHAQMPVYPYLFVNDVVMVGYDIYSEVKGVVSVEKTDLRSALDKERVYKVNFELPSYVSSARNTIEKLVPFSTYEADITYSRRLFIDKVFEVKYDSRRVLFLDVELDNSEGFKEAGQMPFLSYAAYYDGKYIVRHVSDFESEWHFLHDLYSLIVDNGVSVIVGWNVGFDCSHFEKRIEYLRTIMKKGGKQKFFGMPYISSVELRLPYQYDMREEYKAVVKGLVGYSLDEVAKYEGLGGKLERPQNVASMSKKDLLEYNLRDVELLVELEKRYRFVERDMYLCEEVNLPMDYAKVAGVLGDSLILRRLRELGYVAPNVVKHKKKGYEGAMVIDPKPGLYENVLCMDVVSLYPTALLDLNIDILDFGGQVVPHYVAYFFRRKQEEEQKGNKIGRETYKLLANSIYGLFGYEFFRFFDESKAAAITKRGREVLMKMKQIVEELGLQVLYGDTDSLFVKIDGIGDPQAIVDYINSQLSPYRVSLDMVFEKIIFLGSEKRGVKKRYIGVSGDKWKVRGLELRRGDWSMFSKRILWEVIKMIFEGRSKREVETYLADVKARLYRGEFDEELKMVKSIRRGDQYKVQPAHYKLWLEGVKRGLIPPDSTEVEFYYKRGVKSGLLLGLWAEKDKKFDYDEYWQKQVLAPVSRIISSVWKKDDSATLERFLR